MCKLHCNFTSHWIAAGLILAAVLGLIPTFAETGPCSVDMPQFGTAVSQIADNRTQD
jgi:hypothetical protein